MIVNPHGGLKKGLDILEKVKPVFEDQDTQLDGDGVHVRELRRELDLAFEAGDGGLARALRQQ